MIKSRPFPTNDVEQFFSEFFFLYFLPESFHPLYVKVLNVGILLEIVRNIFGWKKKLSTDFHEVRNHKDDFSFRTLYLIRYDSVEG